MSQKIINDEVPWSDKLIVVCTKCGAKASSDPTHINPADRIKTELKVQISKDQKKSQFRAITSSCLDICPEGRIAIVEITRGANAETRALTVDSGITIEELKEKFLK